MADNLLENLNEEQTKAVTHSEGPLMIIAGAGTGKTTVIAHRIGWLIEQQKAKSDQILALTFTEKAAAEMEERVDRLLPMGYLDLWISTFHSFCERILKAHALDIGIPNDFKLLNETDAWLLVRQNFDRFNLDYYRPAGNPTKFIKALLQHFSRAKDEHVTPKDYLNYVDELEADTDSKNAGGADELARQKELANAYHTYQQLLLENSAMDFGDLILYTLELFKKRPAILKRYQEQFKYILVDEFQDTNWAQYQLVKMLARPENNITVVGDDDQSIYKFRGAALSNILQFQKDYKKTIKVVLVKNYRSTQEILDAAYKFIQMNNPNRLEVQLEDGLTKRLESARISIPTELSVEKGSKTKAVRHIHCQTIDEEARAVSEQILELHKSGVPLSEIAILVRANDTALPFISYLERANIPFQFMALKGLYRKPIILDALAYLRIIDHPYHSPSMYRILSHPMIGIHPRELVKLTHEAYKKGKSLIQIMQAAARGAMNWLTEDTVLRCRDLLNMFDSLSEIARQRPASELYVEAIKQSGLLGYVKTLSEREQQEQFQLLQQFFERIKRFETISPEINLHNFLQELEHEMSSGDEGALKADPEIGPEQVRIMTVHGSKGLEYGHVFVVGMVDRRFPTSERKDPIPLSDSLIKESIPEGDIHLEEERRLMYVALTRAKDTVYLTSAVDYGGVRKKKLSRFLTELGFGENEPRPTTLEQEFVQNKQDRFKETNAHISIPDAFSFTQLAAFSNCPLQYKFAHILKVPVFGRYVMSYGKTMHNTLQKFFEVWKERQGTPQQSLFDEDKSNDKNTIPVTLDELIDMYTESWIDEWYENDAQREEYRSLGTESLKNYYQELENNPPSPIVLEKGFTIKFGDVVLRGRIDRIDQIDGGVEIIDYKTGKPKLEDKLTKDDKRQLMIYQIAALECFDPPLVPKKLTFHYLNDNSRVSFLGTDENLAELKRDIQETVKEIRKSEFNPKPGYMCKYCDFNDICEFRDS